MMQSLKKHEGTTTINTINVQYTYINMLNESAKQNHAALLYTKFPLLKYKLNVIKYVLPRPLNIIMTSVANLIFNVCLTYNYIFVLCVTI